MWVYVEAIICSELFKIGLFIVSLLLLMFQFEFTGLLCLGLWMNATFGEVKKESWLCALGLFLSLIHI